MAAAAGTLKRLSLEHGGKAPVVVFAGANLDIAIPEIVHGAVPISGQMCMAVACVLVDEKRYDEVAEKLITQFG
jgi:acyl-CoA reductase-like NAD-dependent aldehyde dehydrogenase